MTTRPMDAALLPEAWTAAEEAFAYLGDRAGRVEIAGELRRQCETIHEVVVIAMSAPRDLPREEAIHSRSGIPIRILWRAPEVFEGCWLWESSSEVHRESLRTRAQQCGLYFSANGLRYRGIPLPFTEEWIYRNLALVPVHPLLREGPVDESATRVTLAGPESIHGIFHVHTTDSDGRGTLEEMVVEAARLGYLWIGISDHSQRADYAGGLKRATLRAQGESIRALQAKHPSIRILHGVESDIHPDGSLDYPDKVLDELDFVIVSVHDTYEMDREAMTARIERALSHPAATIWGHPSGRLLPGPPLYEMDTDFLLETCARNRVAVEFNANPFRLDLDWRWIPRARALGVPVAVDPDAHTPTALAFPRQLVGNAAKGGLTPADVLNNRNAEEIVAWLTARRRS
jgi:DNA polymerase (family 10)